MRNWGWVGFGVAMALPLRVWGQTNEGVGERERAGTNEVQVVFNPRSAALDPKAKATLEDLWLWLRGDESRQAVVEHAEVSPDEVGQDALADERLSLVRKVLRSGGDVDEERIHVRPLGSEPLALQAEHRVVAIRLEGPEAAAGAAATAAPAANTPPVVRQPPASPPLSGHPGATTVVETPAAAAPALPEPAREEGSGSPRGDAPRRPAVRTQAGPLTRPSDVGSRYEYGASTESVAAHAAAWRDPTSPTLSTAGFAVTVGGGVTGFWDADTADVAATGGAWEARLVYGTRTFLAGELAYVGSAQSLTAADLAEDALLVGQGAEGALRVNFSRSTIQPYVFGGAGWTHYDVHRTRTPAGMNPSDNVFHVPLGLGLSLRNEGLVFDVRGTARLAFDETLLRSTFANRAGGGDLDSWNVSARLGWEF